MCFISTSELICTECLHVRAVTSHSAVLHWWPIQLGGLSDYELQYGETEKSIETYRKLALPPDYTWTELGDLQPDTHYSVQLTAHTPLSTHTRTLSAGFTTLPGEEEIPYTAASFFSQNHQNRTESALVKVVNDTDWGCLLIWQYCAVFYPETSFHFMSEMLHSDPQGSDLSPVLL